MNAIQVAPADAQNLRALRDKIRQLAEDRTSYLLRSHAISAEVEADLLILEADVIKRGGSSVAADFTDDYNHLLTCCTGAARHAARLRAIANRLKENNLCRK